MPLTASALALLGEPGEAEALVFSGAGRAGAPLSDMSLTAVLLLVDMSAALSEEPGAWGRSAPDARTFAAHPLILPTTLTS